LDKKPYIAVSYHPLEWWYRHLCNGLVETTEVRQCPAPFAALAGFSWETPVARLLPEGIRPDCFIGSVDMLHPDIPFLDCPTAVWFDSFESDREHMETIRLFDQNFVSSATVRDQLRASGFTNVYWLPHAFDTTFDASQKLQRVLDVCFVGATGLEGHEKRRALLEVLSSRYTMNNWRVPVNQEEMYRLYGQSRIVVNIPHQSGLNMRTFEAMACGALLLNEAAVPGLDELFEDGRHFVSYRNCQELLENIDYYLEHEEERSAIAEAGRAEVISRHSYRHRAQELLRVVAEQAGARKRVKNQDKICAAYAVFYHRRQRLDLLIRLLRHRYIKSKTRAFILQRTLRCFLSQVRGSSPLAKT
jgi:glycosyltransferase involved in cell wall biosynthesis